MDGRMNSFLRAIRLAFQYRWTLGAGFVCSLLAAVLWGANIGAAYPFIEVVFCGKSLHHWVDDEIAKCETAIADADKRIAELNAEKKAVSAQEAAGIAHEISLLETRRTA